MSHEIARTSYLSWIPSIFRVRGESSEGVSYFRLALGVAVFAGGFFVIRKIFGTNASIEPKTTTDRTDEENPLVVVVPKQGGSPPINPDHVAQVDLKVSSPMDHQVVENKGRVSDSDDSRTPPRSPRHSYKKKESTSSDSDDMDDLIVDELDHSSSHRNPPPLIATPVTSPVKPDGRSPSQVINVVDYMQPTSSSKKSDSDDDDAF